MWRVQVRPGRGRDHIAAARRGDLPSLDGVDREPPSRRAEHVWLPVHGQHYVFKGVTIKVVEDDRMQS